MIFRLVKTIVRLLSFLFALGLLLSYLSAIISPANFWFFQLFGLAYPILLVGTLVFSVLNFLLRRKFMFTLIILLIGSLTHANYFGISLQSSNKQEMGTDKELTIMSFNVRLFDVYQILESNTEDSKEKFILFFKQNSSDILCLQEYAEDKTRSSLLSPEELMKIGGYKYHVTTLTLEAKKMSMGQAIFSKYPIVNSGTVGDSTANIPSLYADIVKGEDTIRVYNFHLESIRFQKDEYSLFDNTIVSDKGYSHRITGLLCKLKEAYPLRIQQVQQLIDHAQESPFPTVLNGDLNDPPTSYTYSLLAKHFKDAFYVADFGMTRTYAGKVPAGRIDYVFYKNDIKLTPQAFKTHNEKVLSDHYPISAKFILD